MDLAAREREKYTEVWKDPDYRVRCHGLDLWSQERDLYGDKPASAIDFGCGTGRLVAQWQREGIDAIGVDIAATAPDPGLSIVLANLWELELPRRYELGNCTDVMEHIPPVHVDAVLERIAAACERCVFKIANYPSMHGDGMLHLTMQPRGWWAERLSRLGSVCIPPYDSHGVEEYIFQVTF